MRLLDLDRPKAIRQLKLRKEAVKGYRIIRLKILSDTRESVDLKRSEKCKNEYMAQDVLCE